MKIKIEPARIKKSPENQVTSSNIFKKNQRKISDDYKFDDEGLFSKKIFGRIGTCECGELNKPGFCKICGCRVIDKNNIPDFFIDLGISVPKLYADFGKYKDVKDLLEFNAFLYDDGSNEVVIDNGKIDTDKYDETKIVIGLDAARMIHPDIDEWADKWMTDFINVPHPLFRSNLRLDNNKIMFTPVNKALISVLQNLERVNQFKDIFSDRDDINYYLMSFYREVYDQYINCMGEIYYLFAGGGKRSFVGSDMRAHRVTGAVKGTVVNRFDVDEDVLLIGDTFIQTLYPYLYHKFDGDMEKINDYFVDNNEVVLFNRPPTICHLSIIALKPRVASCYKHGTFKDGAVGKNSKSEYDEENDTIGIRTLGYNPIVSDGLAGDYDGDVHLVIALYSEAAKRQAREMLPSKNFMNYANGNVRNVIPEDIEYIRS